MLHQAKRLFEFGPFRIDTANRILFHDGRAVPLKPKVVDTLLMLIDNSGRVLEKEELMSALWPDSFVEEGNLTQNIHVLRKALNDDTEAESYIETMPRRGYRFVGQVKELLYEAEAAQLSRDEKAGAPCGVPSIVSQTGMARLLRGRLLIVAILGTASIAAGYYFLFSGQAKRPVENAQIKTLAILPFKPMGAEAGDEYMGQGMADALVTKLSNNHRITVRPTSVVLRNTRFGEDPLAAGRSLDVAAVLDGNFQRDGDRVRVTVQLLRVADGALLWAEKFDQKFTDIFAVQDSISAQVMRSLMLQLTGNEREIIRKHYTENVEAYQAYLQGRYFWNKRSSEGFKKAVEYFQRAIEIDPNYALAYAGLADCYIRLNEYGVPMAQEAVPRGRAAVLKALEIDEALAEAHATLAFIKFRHDWDLEGAGQEFRRSLELDDNYAEAHQWYAFYLLSIGKRDQADAEMKRSQELDPLSVSFNANSALYLFFTHQFDQSIQQGRKTLEMEPNFLLTRVTLGLSYEQQGSTEAAIAELEKARELYPDDGGTIAALGHAYAKAGRAKNARDLLRTLEERAKTSYVQPYGIAVVHAGLGEKAQAFEWLERAFQDRSLRLVWLKFDPRLDALRQEANFIDLMRRVGLAP